MRTLLYLLAITGAIIVAGCSPVYVDHDYDKDADFTSYSTWAWYVDLYPEARANQAAQINNPLAARRLEAQVEDLLGEKGLSRTTSDPGILILYYTSSQNVTEITRTGYWGTMGSVSARNYEDGTLIIDFMDASKEQLVWRGTAETTLSSNPSPEEVDKTIRTAVQKILAGYPPK